MKITPEDFNVSKFYTYFGPNHYINCKAVVFNIFLEPDGPEVDFYIGEVLKYFPQIKEKKPSTVINLFAETLLQVSKMDIDLYIKNYEVSQDDKDYVIAIEYLDKNVTEDCVHAVSEWFKAMNNKENFDFKTKFEELQAEFDKTMLGGPTLYSLVEAGLKRNIPTFFLHTENQYQWGYGRKQLRGRSTTMHTDGIKDTEFTMYKDMVGDFLIDCGFPTPIGEVTFSADEAVAVAKDLKFPVVVKPVAGHKGQGVTTGIESEEEVIKAYNNIVKMAEKEGVNFDGVLVQQQIYGTDHRLLTVGGKFAAALQRVPAFVEGDGNKTIEELIKIENDKLIRLDNARSPLCKINIDEDLLDYLKLQKLTLKSVPKKNECIYLRRVANISAGGVSFNVTDKIHPENIRMLENIAKFFKVKCLGIDVLAKDISRPWTEGNFGIIEINAGPGVFMHLAPAYGGSIDVPGKIILSHFDTAKNSRIPIIAGNFITKQIADALKSKIEDAHPEKHVSYLVDEGVYFEGEYFHKNKHHDKNVEIILRHPETDVAIFNHTEHNIWDYGFFHEGADLVILKNPSEDELKMKELLLKKGIFVLIEENDMTIEMDGNKEKSTIGDLNNELVLKLEPYLEQIITKYD